MSLILKYKDELAKDTHIDELNVTQMAHTLPALKHKWVARLIDAKLSLKDFEMQKKNLRLKFFDKIKSETATEHLKLSSLAIEKAIDSSSSFKEALNQIEEKVEDLKLVILYLEKVEVIFKNMTYDIKNIIDLNRLETT